MLMATNRNPIAAALQQAANRDSGAADLSNAPVAHGHLSRVATIRSQEG
ncbi:hypothetical protein AKL17_1892 [Frigidibacter mobilis]|uniref:Uncharacterized protein n=1 Tax=Frigidibacter mobilis TaxID=1335048 RepID=A0A159Z2E0_9RHOB|nr:hypothetical protein AKL17_1892 [Frigidibacter mobilis]